MLKDKDFDLLVQEFEKVTLFREMDISEIKDVINCLGGRRRHLDPHMSYVTAGDVMNKVAIILEGSMNESKISSLGEEDLIAKLNRRYLVGFDVACTQSRVSPYDIYTPSGADIYEFEFDRIRRSGIIPDVTREKLLWNIMIFLANENIRHQYKIDVLSSHNIRDRIMTYLETRALKLGTSEFTIPFNREEMANYMRVNRSALSHELGIMKKEGIIDFRKNWFKIL